MANRITALIEYAREINLLPLSGKDLFNLQSEAFKITSDYDSNLNDLLKDKFNISLTEWLNETEYMSKHYYPTLKPEHKKINSFIRQYAKERRVYQPAYKINYFYSLLNNAAKSGQIKRKRKDRHSVYLYY